MRMRDVTAVSVSYTAVSHSTREAKQVTVRISFLIKPTEALISQIYFCQETLYVSDSSSAHHQEFSIVHSALVYVMRV